MERSSTAIRLESLQKHTNAPEASSRMEILSSNVPLIWLLPLHFTPQPCTQLPELSLQIHHMNTGLRLCPETSPDVVVSPAGVWVGVQLAQMRTTGLIRNHSRNTLQFGSYSQERGSAYGSSECLSFLVCKMGVTVTEPTSWADRKTMKSYTSDHVQDRAQHCKGRVGGTPHHLSLKMKGH